MALVIRNELKLLFYMTIEEKNIAKGIIKDLIDLTLISFLFILSLVLFLRS